MFRTDFIKISDGAVSKVAFMKKDPLAYFVVSMLAGAYIGIGVLLAFTSGGLLTGLPYARIVMGLTFGVALSLVVMAGAELFTGNNLAMAAGLLDKKVAWKDALSLWCICWAGNLAGGMLLAAVYHKTGLCTGPVADFMVSAAGTKMGTGAAALFARGILCNFLVCLAVWCAGRASSDSGKLIMIFWCLFAFITTGFEHSIANMTLFTIALLQPVHEAVTAGGFFYNLAIVTLGNIVGGALFVAAPYYIAGRKDK
ncbi:MAG: formate/nitrite transporter family protein [Mogibacterium sp.]|nr:formate/nitrite transporter family protein [Mogibacterium sp.]